MHLYPTPPTQPIQPGSEFFGWRSARRRLMAHVLAGAAVGLGLGAGGASAQTLVGVELAGVKYPPTEPVGNATLTLNGAGIRYKAIFKVYTAGLYLPTRQSTPEAILAETGPRRMHIVMLREIDANELGKLFTQGMEKNAPREVFAKSINGTVRLAELFVRKKRLAAGDTFTVDWLPGKGTVVSVNGVAEIQPIPEPEFFQALLGIWLGKAPADDRLKAALLGSGGA